MLLSAKDDLDESIADLVYAISELNKINEILQDSSTYSGRLPKRNETTTKDIEKLCVSIQKKLKIAQNTRRTKYGND